MDEKKARHEKALAPETFILSVIMAAAAAAICMQIISRIGITPNTSIIGAIVAMTLARVPLPLWLSSVRWRDRTWYRP